MQCPICKSENLQFIYEFADSPATQHNLYSSFQEALFEKKVLISLYGCRNCQFVFNANFDISKIVYSSNYDNTQENSKYIQVYLLKLAKRIVKKYNLKDKKVVEIGCGKGYFLKTLYDLGVKNIKGFDPTYIDYNVDIDKLIVKDFFRGETEKADFIICRHVLEHVPTPRDFIYLIEKCLTEDGTMYFEFPDLDWIIKNKAFFDFFHEHRSYFTKKSASVLFNSFGFQDIVFNYGLGGQYFQLEISRGIGQITRFIKEKMADYKRTADNLDNFAVWGAGAKGLVFLNRMNISRDKCKYIIDINPNKQGKFVAITGQEIVSPEILGKEKIDTILIMNPIYGEEIKKMAEKYDFKGKFILL